MIIHHQDGTDWGIHPLVKAVVTTKRMLVLCYASPGKGRKAIVEIPQEELVAIVQAITVDKPVDHATATRWHR